MRAHSRVLTWLSYPDVKAARVALAAGSLAGLAVLGACYEETVTTKVAGPTVSEPVFATGVVGANSHTVQVCVDNASPPGTYNFAVSFNATESQFDLERTTSSDPVIGGGVEQNSLGPFVPGDVITAAPSITLAAGALVPECVIVFQRNETATHENNRLWTFPSGLGIVNPFGTINVDAAIPAGYTYTATCTNDDPNLAQTAGCATTSGGIVADPIFTSANVFHGSVVNYKFTAPVVLPCPAGSFTFAMDGSGNLQIEYDQFPAPNDNSYGANAVGWAMKGKNPGHTFKDLVNSDHAGIQIRNTSGQIILSFLVDYLSAATGTPSGYASLGVTGGDGKMLTGTASGITATTSLAKNLNTNGWCSGGSCNFGGTNLLVDSPPTVSNTSYTLVAGSPFGAWDFHNTYFVTIAASKVATFGAGWTANANTVQPNLAGLHNSPAKVCPDAN